MDIKVAQPARWEILARACAMPPVVPSASTDAVTTAKAAAFITFAKTINAQLVPYVLGILTVALLGANCGFPVTVFRA